MMMLLARLVVGVRGQMVWPLYPQPYQHSALVASQFHTQDILGQYNFGYSGNNQFRTESKILDGSVLGSYSYVDPNNKLVYVVYVSDEGGFRLLGGNNLPTVPATQPSPQTIDYTPEVAAARAEFEKTYNELATKAAANSEMADSNSSRKKRSVFWPTLYTFQPSTLLKVNVTEGELVKDVISPADTQAVEFMEVEKSVPFAPVLVAPTLNYASTPLYSPFWLH